MVTCIICLPFAFIYLLHLTLYFWMSRQRVQSTQPHHACALFWRAMQLYICAIKSLFSSLREQALIRKTPVNWGNKFPASFGSQGEQTPGSLQYKV